VPDQSSHPRALAWLLLAAILLAALSVACATSAGAEPARPEYVKQLETICKPGSEATERAVRGMRSDIRAERLQLAARKFAKAKRIFAGTVSSISKVARPAADRGTLSRWFTALDRETVLLGQIASALHAENIARFQRVQGLFAQQGSKANNVVVSFGFNSCLYKPSRYE